jgi:hypothetical protein
MRALLSAAAIVCAASNANAFEFRFAKLAVAGQSTELAGHSTVLAGNCYTKPGSVAVTLRPAHGVLSTRIGDNPIKAGPGIIDRCVGKTGRGTLVFYRPNAGYVGADEARWTITFTKFNGSTESRDIIATLRVVAKSPLAGWTAPR